MAKVRYVDTFGFNNAHEQFNAALLVMCTLVFDQVECHASLSNYECMRKIIGKEPLNHVKYRSNFVVKGNGKISLLFRYLISAWNNFYHLILVPKDTLLIFPFNNLFGVRLLNFTNKILKKKILIFCHGEMEGIASNVHKAGILSKILIRCSRKFFLNKQLKLSQGIYFGVLGDCIVDNMSHLIDSDKMAKFINIDHPYIFKSQLSTTNSDDLLHVGTVGSFSKTKGANQFIALVEGIQPSVSSKIKFSVTGRIFDVDVQCLHNLNVDLPDKYEMGISREEFNKRVSLLDYLLFFYSNESYKLTASGAIFDAIAMEKPILSLQNDYFQYIFTKFGGFGYLFENVHQMIPKLEEVAMNKNRLCVDFESLKSQLSPQAISVTFSKELKRVDLLL